MQAVSTVNNLNALYTRQSSLTRKYPKAETSTQDSWQTPVDTFTPSGQVPTSANQQVNSTTSKTNGQNALAQQIQDFDINEFHSKIHAQLLDLVKQGKDALKNSDTTVDWTSDIPYAVDSSVQAADVPEEWNADNTSQRIVDFAMQFRDAAKQSGMSDEDFMAQIKSAVQDGFRLAKNDLQDLPSSVAKLFNDTYQSTMDKLDKVLASWKSETSGTDTSASIAAQTASEATSQADAGATTATATTATA